MTDRVVGSARPVTMSRSRRARRGLAAILLGLAAAIPVGAQAPQRNDAGAAGDLRIVLITVGPGELIYERFGHNALWVHDPEAGTDVAYNYGVFDFGRDDFVTNFLLGRMVYWLEGWNAYATLRSYRAQDRDIWLQELALTPEQARALRDFLVWNAHPAHREYRYDYYLDNCSTRVRDALDSVLAGALRAATAAVPTGTTFRWHTARLTGERAADVPEFTGLMIGLGPAADRPISAWEAMFLPMKLREGLDRLRIPGPDGSPIAVVRSETRYHRAGDGPERDAPPCWWPGYLAAGLLIGGSLVLLAHRGRTSRGARVCFAALGGCWLLAAGSCGVVLAALWALTDHAVAYRNHNLFHLSPLALAVLAVGIARRRVTPAIRRLAAAVAGLSLLGLAVGLIPGIGQVNHVVVALAVPVNLALAWALCRRRGRAPDRRMIGPAR